MGCDIHTRIEIGPGGTNWQSVPIMECPLFRPITRDSEWERESAHEIWADRNYAVFGVLANVRNYSGVPPLSEPRGWPEDVAPETVEWTKDDCNHSASWFSLHELMLVDWDAPCEDRRYTKQVSARVFDCGATAEPGCGVMKTYREHMGERFFKELEILRQWAADRGLEPEEVRILFNFDN